MTPKPESETDHEQAIRDYYAHCDQAERAEAAELPPVPNIVAALDTGTATPELISEWANHPYVCTTDIIRRAIAVLLAARAAEAAQHRQEIERLARINAENARRLLVRDDEIAAQDDELVMLRKGLKEACRQNVELRAERDRLKAALSKITALDFEKFNGRHNFYSGAVMFVKAWLLAYAALTPQGQSTDGETR